MSPDLFFCWRVQFPGAAACLKPQAGLRRRRRPSRREKPVPLPLSMFLIAIAPSRIGARQHRRDHVGEAPDQHALAQEAQHQHGDHHAGDAAFPAEDADAAQHHHGDGAQQQHVAHVGTHRAVIGGQNDAGQRGHAAADDIGAEQHARHLHARIARGVRVVADHDDATPELAARHQKAEQQGEHGEQQDLERQDLAECAGAEGVEAVGKSPRAAPRRPGRSPCCRR